MALKINTSLLNLRVMAAVILGISAFWIYQMTPTFSEKMDTTINSLFSRCSSSVLNNTYDELACAELFQHYANITRSATYSYISDDVMFELHRSIQNQGHIFDIDQATNGFLQQLPSGKYHSTRRNSIIDAFIKSDTTTSTSSDEPVIVQTLF
ncbi:hypothetical protein J4N45_11160 [Vibrio sp. SCSIO 43140]|uniref:hypothetical protein n=1 Tax=Vibrio sp. SCSIO 43140 TaxID=2819100 RepID=UPI002074D276|nr:hypothetical protein [Vibrio sp. SCSIO 43140]USD59090.1 hypothetical protein J4N45_11160 [Vibrio sp. SCSIO 43140]